MALERLSDQIADLTLARDALKPVPDAPQEVR
jgi:hypothetical protein